MLQQTAAAKTDRRLGWFDGLFADTSEKKEIERDLSFLADDYTAFVRIGSNLSSHSRWVPYPFLTNRLRKVADELRTQAELVRAKIAALGGQVPQVSIENRELLEFRQNVRRLVKDMEEHASRTEILVHQRNQIRNPDIIKFMDSLISITRGQKNELLDITMRLS